MAIEINVGGTWKTIDDCGINVGGTWKTPTAISINVGGTWKEVWPTGTAPTVSPNTTNYTVIANTNPCIAGISFFANGQEYGSDANGGGVYNVSRGAWLDTGSSSDAWVQRVISSGTLNYTDPGSGRLNLGSAREFAVSDSQYAGTEECILTFNFYDAASGGNLIGTSGSITLTADRSK